MIVSYSLFCIQGSNAAELDQDLVLARPSRKRVFVFVLFILQEANSVLHSTSSSLLIDIQAMYVCAWSQNLGIIFDTIFFKNSAFSLLCGFVNNFHQARPTSFTQNNANISVHSQRLNSFISQWTGSYLHQLILCLHINN